MTPLLIAIVSICDLVKGDAEPPVVLPPVLVNGTNSTAELASEPVNQSVSALTRTQMDHTGISSTLNLWQAVPNFSQSHAGLSSYTDIYSIRGLGNTEFLSDPAVVLYIDDVPFEDVASYESGLLSVDRVEIYRGPQGTKFGRNAEAGVMNIVTRKPGPEMEAEARASYSSFNTQDYQALALGPIIKNKLFFSLAGQYDSSDGFIHNTFLNSKADHQEGLNGRAKLLWTPVENWEVDFTLTGHKFDNGIGLEPLNAPPQTTRSDFDGKFNERANGESLRVSGDLSGLVLTSVTARRDFHLNPFQFDVDFSPVPGNTGTVHRVQVSWSEELRLQPSEPGENWNWQAGFYFSTTDAHINERGDFFIPQLGLPAVDLFEVAARSDTYALFGDCSRTIGKQFKISVGLRLEDTAREVDRTHTATLGSSLPFHAAQDFYNAAPELTLTYRLSERLSFYAKTGLGFKPGGFSPYIDPPMSPKYSTETTWASEAGTKSSWLEDRLLINAALFYNYVRDYQVEQFIPNGFDFTIVNAPRAQTAGFELELAARPIRALELKAFSGVTEARLETYTNPFTGVTVRDSRPPFVAEFNAGVAGEYRFAMGLFARLEYAAVGDTFYDAANAQTLKQSEYGLLSARIGVERKHWGLYFFAQNLSDASYFTKKVPPLNAGAPGQPRTFGLMATALY